MAHFLDLDLSFLGWPHMVASLVAMAAFVRVIFTRKGGEAHRTWGRIYAISYATLCITGLGIYRLHRFFFPHWLAVGGLAVLGIGYLAARYRPKGWRYIHLTAMLLSAYNLFGGAVNEVFLRVRPLRAVLGDNPFASPVFGMTHGIVGQTFIVLIVAYIIITAVRSPRKAKRPLAAEGDVS
jgi:hypothetical protein